MRPSHIININKVHRKNTEQKTHHPAELHVFYKPQTVFQAFDLPMYHGFVFPIFIFGVQVSYKACKRKEPVGISQHNKADSRKKQCRCINGDIHISK